jgi:hypothetical protein
MPDLEGGQNLPGLFLDSFQCKGTRGHFSNSRHSSPIYLLYLSLARNKFQLYSSGGKLDLCVVKLWEQAFGGPHDV